MSMNMNKLNEYSTAISLLKDEYNINFGTKLPLTRLRSSEFDDVATSLLDPYRLWIMNIYKYGMKLAIESPLRYL